MPSLIRISNGIASNYLPKQLCFTAQRFSFHRQKPRHETWWKFKFQATTKGQQLHLTPCLEFQIVVRRVILNLTQMKTNWVRRKLRSQVDLPCLKTSTRQLTRYHNTHRLFLAKFATLLSFLHTARTSTGFYTFVTFFSNIIACSQSANCNTFLSQIAASRQYLQQNLLSTWVHTLTSPSILA